VSNFNVSSVALNVRRREDIFGMLTTGLSLVLWSIAQSADAKDGSFDDLGKLLFGGLLSAIVVAVVVAVLKVKNQNRSSTSTDFVSINPSRHEDRS
jgi:hypothetical protein